MISLISFFGGFIFLQLKRKELINKFRNNIYEIIFKIKDEHLSFYLCNLMMVILALIFSLSLIDFIIALIIILLIYLKHQTYVCLGNDHIYLNGKKITLESFVNCKVIKFKNYYYFTKPINKKFFDEISANKIINYLHLKVENN